MSDESIIIKKVIKKGGGHHGGAWKVAYADFVTAMMAFFLLLWLLNATEAEQLSGLADYFAPTVGVRDNMGIGFRGGKAALSKGIGADRSTNKGIVFGGVPTGPIVKVTEKFELVTNEADAEKVVMLVGDVAQNDASDEKEVEGKAFSEAAESLEKYINNAEAVGEHSVTVKEKLRGLEVQIKSRDNSSMFEKDSAIIKHNVRRSLEKLTAVLRKLPNAISISGYTSAVPVKKEGGYSNWELSVDRANAVRRFMIDSGLWAEQIVEIIGKADNYPLNPRDPFEAVNNRISLLLLKSDAIPSHKRAAPERVVIDPESNSMKDLIEDIEDNEEEIEDVSEKPANAHLFVEEELKPEEVDEYRSLQVQDPFNTGAIEDPFKLNEDE